MRRRMESAAMGAHGTLHGARNKETYQLETSLHRAWAGLNFDRRGLATLDRQAIRILQPGTVNHDQGPDFLDAEIQIGKTRHHGHVELHLHADDWRRHGHHLDPHYNPVMLHVFLVPGQSAALRADGTAIPELCLGDRIGAAPAPTMAAALPCSGLASRHLPASPRQWMERAGLERLGQKAGMLQRRLSSSNYNWSQVLWEELAAGLGGPVNGIHFRALAEYAHWDLVRRHVFSQSSLEALLFGVCGMLEGPPLDAYQGQLKADWEYLRCKHRLAVQPIPFKFHRMHPGGFPTLRMAQLAMIAVAFRPLCQLLQVGEIRRFYEDDWNNAGYWACRYEFGNTLHGRRSELGKDTRMRLVLNALAPLVLLADGGSWGGVMAGDGAGSTGKVWPDPGTGSGRDGLSHLPGKPVGDLLEFLRWLPPEANKITRQFLPLGLKPGNALEAQGLIGIFKTRCNAFRCLECEIGRSAMGSGEGA